jgi:hypothetical protein
MANGKWLKDKFFSYQLSAISCQFYNTLTKKGVAFTTPLLIADSYLLTAYFIFFSVT